MADFARAITQIGARMPSPLKKLKRPKSEADVIDLIRRAANSGAKVRVCGSKHSVPAAILAPTRDRPKPFNISLEKMRGIRLVAATTSTPAQAIVEAGCHLGDDPMDSSATWDRSLIAKLASKELALPDLGGITHQTVSGFLNTGSSGGTVQNSNYEQWVALNLVDGRARLHKLSRNSSSANFLAAGISMGLLGVITEVTLNLVPRYHIIGETWTKPTQSCEIDLFGDAPDYPSLKKFLEQHEYARLLWWPQKNVDRVVVWHARKMQPGDYNAETGTPSHFIPKPYELVAGKFPQLAQLLAGVVLNASSSWPPGPVMQTLLERVLPPLLEQFAPIEDKKTFWDHWYHGLPMDNALNEKHLPLEFTEFKFPLSRSTDVLKVLRDHYRNGLLATGMLACELYAAKSSDFWMSSSSGTEDVLKVDLLWYKNRRTSPDEVFFPQFWELLRPYNFKLHWGKYLPKDPARSTRHGSSWVDYLRSQYPKWNDFMTLRQQFDPQKLFVTPYWKEHLGIT